MDTANRRELAQGVRAARKSRGWSQSELASRAHVSLRTVQNAEAGRDPLPSLKALRDIHAALAVDPAAQTAPVEDRKWSGDVDALVNVIGLFVDSLEGEERQAWINHLTRAVVLRDLP